MSIRSDAPTHVSPESRQFLDRLGDYLHLEECHLVDTHGHLPTMKSVLIGRIRFVCMEGQSELKLKVKIGAPSFVAWIVRKGHARFQLKQEIVMCSANTGCIWPASTDIRISASPDFSAILVRIDRSMLEHKLASLLGRPIRDPLVFSSWLKVDTPRSIFGPLLKFLVDTIDQKCSALTDSPVLSAGAEHLFLATVLTTQVSNYSDALNGLNVVVVPRHLRTVIKGIRANPSQDWRLTLMAKEAGVSVRTICESFQRFCSCTPKQFVQRVRLARAHEILAGLSEPKSVAGVARECGFHHPGRFSATYRQVYGESPTETLRMSLVGYKRKADMEISSKLTAELLADCR